MRQYRKDFDNTRRSLHKAEDNYALEKNREMLIGAELDVRMLPNRKAKAIARNSSPKVKCCPIRLINLGMESG